LYSSSILENYVASGGKCVIIIGEDEDGCTNPSYNVFTDQPDWDVVVHDIPNFSGIYTKMSISVRR
jgi:hypothetical protein